MAPTSTASFWNWSPDGKRIVFVSGREGIYVMNADGCDPKRLSEAGVLDHVPAWSPDTTRIIFKRELAGRIRRRQTVSRVGTRILKGSRLRATIREIPRFSPSVSLAARPSA
jgi:dipeptidyl aminopeptidase/acylaminoacyl peptidase